MALEVIQPERSEVPCNGCRTCCQGELLVLHPEMGDDPSEYYTQVRRNPLDGRLVYALQQGKNGDCIYLGEDGCTIHDRAPAICREFDCRKLYLKFSRIPRAARRRIIRQGLLTADVLDAGKARLATLKEEGR